LPPTQQAVFSNPQAVFSNPQDFALGGLFNRIVLAIAFAWYLVTVCRLLRTTRTNPTR